jgi:hypothetical protein
MVAAKLEERAGLRVGETVGDVCDQGVLAVVATVHEDPPQR